MRYSASEKLEIIRLVEQSHQSVQRTLEQIGVSRPTFYRWYDLYRRFGDVYAFLDQARDTGASYREAGQEAEAREYRRDTVPRRPN